MWLLNTFNKDMLHVFCLLQIFLYRHKCSPISTDIKNVLYGLKKKKEACISDLTSCKFVVLVNLHLIGKECLK